MQSRHVVVLVLALALMAVPAGGYMKESHQKIAVKADGTVHVEQSWVFDRSLLQQQLRMLEQVQNTFGPPEEEPAREADEKGDDASVEKEAGEVAETDDQTPEASPAAEDAANDGQPEVTAETEAGRTLATRLLSLYQKGLANQVPGASAAVRSVAVAEKTVTMVVTFDFETPSDFVAATPQMWGEYGFQRLVVDTDDEGHLRFTFTAPQEMLAVFRQRMRTTLTSWKYQGDLRLTLPGEIVSSTFTDTEGTTTGFAVDATDEASLEAYLAFCGTKQVIVCEPGGLPMDNLRLDSRTLAPSRTEPSATEYDDVPITEAGDGFVTEPLGVTTRTVHVFPGAAERLGAAAGRLFYELRSGCEVKAKLYTPTQRQVMGLSGTHLIKAVDDKGRDIPQAADAGYGGVRTYGEASNAVDLTLHLDLPPPDAQAIERLEGETIAITFAGFSEHVLRDIRADTDKRHDLGSLVPGAALTLTKMAFETQRGSVQIGVFQLEVTGPPEIRRLTFEAKPDTGRAMGSHVSRSSYRPKGDKTVAQLELRMFLDMPAGAEKPAVHLTVKMPDDLKRERVRFTLEAIDLY